MARVYTKQQQNRLLKVYLSHLKIYLRFMEQRKEKAVTLLAFTLPAHQFLGLVNDDLYNGG